MLARVRLSVRSSRPASATRPSFARSRSPTARSPASSAASASSRRWSVQTKSFGQGVAVKAVGELPKVCTHDGRVARPFDHFAVVEVASSQAEDVGQPGEDGRRKPPIPEVFEI